MSDIQHTYALLQQMYELMQQIEAQGKTTERQVSQTTTSVRQFEQILMRSLILTRRLGLNDDLSNAAMQIQRTTLLIYQLNAALQALSVISMSNPVGAILAVTGMAITAFNVADSITYDSRG